MTIEDFIAARLAEDEDIAAGARRGPRGRDWSEDYGREFVVLVGSRDGVSDWVVRSTAESQHIARHDPARAVWQAAAIRSAVAYVASITSASEQLVAEAAVLHPIAGIWRTHPDYRTDWDTPDQA